MVFHKIPERTKINEKFVQNGNLQNIKWQQLKEQILYLHSFKDNVTEIFQKVLPQSNESRPPYSLHLRIQNDETIENQAK